MYVATFSGSLTEISEMIKWLLDVSNNEGGRVLIEPVLTVHKEIGLDDI
jgi:hypothetical protein